MNTDFEANLLKALLRIAERARDHAHSEAPYRTSDLKGSHTVQEIGPLEVAMGTNLEYAPYVHQGTGLYGPHQQRIVPKTKKALFWEGAAHPVRSVKGQEANPWLDRTLKAVVPEVPNLVGDLLEAAAAQALQAALRESTIEIKVKL